jgi:hypothetical protein
MAKLAEQAERYDGNYFIILLLVSPHHLYAIYIHLCVCVYIYIYIYDILFYFSSYYKLRLSTNFSFSFSLEMVSFTKEVAKVNIHHHVVKNMIIK